MSEQALEEQFQQAHSIKKKNIHLIHEYQKFLYKKLDKLTTSSSGKTRANTKEGSNNNADLETPLSMKVGVIYDNQRHIRSQEKIIRERVDKMSSIENSLAQSLEKTDRRLEGSNLVQFDNTREINDVVQRKAEKIDRQIRILEASIKKVEEDQSKPAVSVKHGLFG